jgi:ankyrin repeat protein
MGHEHVVRCLVKEFGADVNQAGQSGDYPLYAAAYGGHEHNLRCLLGVCGANVNQPNDGGATALYVAAQKEHERVMRCLVKEFGADVNQAGRDGSSPLNQARRDGSSPLMTAAENKHDEVAVWLIEHGANSQASHPRGFTAADISKKYRAPADQTAYLEARTHCARPGCEGTGLKKRGLHRHPLLRKGLPGGALARAQGRVRA